MKWVIKVILLIFIILSVILLSGRIINSQNKALAQSIDIEFLLSRYYYDNLVSKEIENEKYKKNYDNAKKKQDILIIDYYSKIEEENTKHTNEDIESEKSAYLTFDDGPSKHNTLEILKILDEYDVKATFFVLGVMAENNPETLKLIHENGHSIGNHSYSHKYGCIYKNSENFFADVENCEAVLKNILGEDFNTKLLRFPGGSYGNKKSEIKNQALAKGYNVVDWNALNGDAEKSNPSANYLIKRFKETHKNKKNIIILMHDTDAKENTVKVLPEIIETLMDEGYTIKALDEN